MVCLRRNKYFGLLLIAFHLIASLAVGDGNAKQFVVQDQENAIKERKDKGNIFIFWI